MIDNSPNLASSYDSQQGAGSQPPGDQQGGQFPPQQNIPTQPQVAQVPEPGQIQESQMPQQQPISQPQQTPQQQPQQPSQPPTPPPTQPTPGIEGGYGDPYDQLYSDYQPGGYDYTQGGAPPPPALETDVLSQGKPKKKTPLCLCCCFFILLMLVCILGLALYSY